MRLAARLLTWSTALSLVIGPLAPQLGAQAPPPPPADTSAPVTPAPVEEPSAGAKAGAVAVNIFRIPGKTILCGLGAFFGWGLLFLTGGTQYRAAGAVVREGCGGKWVIGPDDLDRDVDAPKAIFSGEAH
jgi:hypothetical protein